MATNNAPRLTENPHPDHIPQIGRFVVGYTMEDVFLGSASNFATVKQWLHDCENGHLNCWPSEMPMLPTRVIDVGTLPANAQNDEVRIFCSQGRRAKYVALSHCWGGKIEAVLETSNLNSFQNSIPCSSLPATFRDAISITRNLGIQYLWIDSLCIIQDSRDDWEQESNNMGPIFRDSTLALFATASKNSNEGILNKEAAISRPKNARLKVFSDPEDDTTVMASTTCFSPKETFSGMWSASPLATRGWTFQEQVLAPRRLIYGKKGICWKCPRYFQASELSDIDMGTYPIRTPVMDAILHSLTVSCYPRVSLDSTNVINEYYQLVSYYSQRALTFPSDKLPAISAIAKAVSHKLAQENVSSTYLAGLWEMDFAGGLMWEVKPLHAPPVSVYQAPSWSWATTNNPVVYDRTQQWSTDLTVVSCEVCPVNPDYPFGEVKSGRLVVDGRTIPLIRSRQVIRRDLYRHNSLGCCRYDECPDGENQYHFAPRIYHIMKGGQQCLVSFKERDRHPSEFIFGHDDSGHDEEAYGYRTPYHKLKIDEELYCKDEYKAVVISVSNFSSQRVKNVRGILVQRRPGFEEYERIGSLSSLDIRRTWLDSTQRERLVIV